MGGIPTRSLNYAYHHRTPGALRVNDIARGSFQQLARSHRHRPRPLHARGRTPTTALVDLHYRFAGELGDVEAVLGWARGVAPTGPHAIAWAVCQAAEVLREVEGTAVPTTGCAAQARA